MRFLQRSQHEGMYIAIVTGQGKRQCCELRVACSAFQKTRNSQPANTEHILRSLLCQ